MGFMTISARYLSRMMHGMESTRGTHLIPVLSQFKELKQFLIKSTPGVEFIEINPDEKKEHLELLKESEIIIADARLICPYLYDLEKAKWIQGTWAGVDMYLNHIDKTKPKLKYTITRFSGSVSFGSQMAEYLVTHIVMRERNFIKQHENQLNKDWSRGGNIWTFRLLADLNIGILGFGIIAKEVAQILKAFHAKVWVFVRTLPTEDSKVPFVDEYRTLNELPELLASCDYICNILPSTEGTIGLLGNGRLAHCSTEAGGKGAVFVNIGRGSIIPENELVEALEKNWISGAILDVFEKEPLPAESRLWSMPQVTITPHVSGVTRAKDVAELFSKNFALYQSGQPLQYVFDVEKGY
ncbi:glyoxylate/hydroxypyruvate reductase A-like [Ischnura elegans]|uniref:glyoxylate/hydroxypyruvate reductase A-like n=1 Tax=Ischnura elegans TaxID=197161 RepID=UPI001ED8AE40|nr:glyoxylate/hydroxypyruvate reductase A-like [Ischnura elegans]